MARIWIVNQYCMPWSQKPSSRHNQFAKLLSEQGHDVTIFRAKRHHLMHNSELENKELTPSSSFNLKTIPTAYYIDAHDYRRILAWFSFTIRISLTKLKKDKLPDVIWISSPSLISFLGAQVLAKRTGARLVFEVRDIWPQTLVSLGRFSTRHPFIRFLKWVEHRALSKSDHIITTMPGGPDYVAREIGQADKTTWVPNAVSVSRIKKMDVQFGSNTPSIQFSKDRFLVGYTGTLGLANSVDTIIDAAIILKDNPSIGFVIMGKGRLQGHLIQRAKKHGLQNVQFIPHGSELEVMSVLNRLDAGLLCWNNSLLYEFGTSAIKMPLYLACGKPILQAYSGKYDQVSKRNIGITVPAEDGGALASAITSFRKVNKKNRSAITANAINDARNFFAFEHQVKVIERILLKKGDDYLLSSH